MESSSHTEKEGLVRGMKFFENKKLSVGLFVTDRHKQVDRWMRDEMPNTDHRFDVWHVAKGVLCTMYFHILNNFLY